MSEFGAVVLGVFGATALLIPRFLRLLSEGGLHGTNYRGERVPVAAGVLPCLCLALGAALLSTWGRPRGYAFAFGVLAAALVGLLDDAAGNRRATGFAGHLRRLLRGELSTGALKALAVGGVAFVLAATTRRGVAWWIADAALIALTANIINLLDVRPGRAVKATGVLLLVAFPAVAAVWDLLELWTLAAVVLVAYAPFDLRARAMLGDAGANAFGLAAGWLLVQGAGPLLRGGLLVLLILLHAYSEQASLSRAIERIGWLDRFDRWGRPPD